MLIAAALICGFVFGWGLLISGMVQPAKVLAFLDIFGAWDPSLAIVMAAALVVSRAGFVLAKRRKQPLLAAQNLWPAKTNIDRPLVIGSALFGTGWGLVGLCPGPALANLASVSPRVIVFVIAMAAGMVLNDFWQKCQKQRSLLPLTDRKPYPAYSAGRRPYIADPTQATTLPVFCGPASASPQFSTPATMKLSAAPSSRIATDVREVPTKRSDRK
jgi:hypothetical protein